jgi:pimeloyl-ACP methyl ester carboxylesterase
MLNWIKSLLPQEPQHVDATQDGPTVVWLHGANQTSLSFNFLRERCNFTKEYLIDYSSMNRFYANLETMVEELEDLGPLFVVGHSLGGLYALHLTQHVDVVGGVSISTPFRGSSTADWAKYMVPSYPLFKDIGRRSLPVQDSFKIYLDIPWTQIVSTSGAVPYHNGPNDGVVTLASMEHRQDMEKIRVEHTHYEVMCSNRVAELVKMRYADCQTDKVSGSKSYAKSGK